MAITQFIKDLLFTSDKLIIPGFGGFVAKYVSAQIDSDKIIPPSKHFIFDASLIEDDGIFSNYVCKKTSTSLSEARNAVTEMVNDFWKKLSDGDTLLIEGVGYFSMDNGKHIRFENENKNNFNPETYGLSELSYKKPIQLSPVFEDEEVPVKRKSILVRILVIFLIVNAAGALSALVYWKFENIKSYFQHFSESKKDSAVVTNDSNYNINPDTSALGQSIDTTTNIKNALRYEEASKIDSVTKSTPEVSYYIIAGSFRSFKKAENQVNYLKKQGFNPEIIEFSQQTFRVSVGEYKTKEQALSQLEVVKTKKGTEAAWLLMK